MAKRKLAFVLLVAFAASCATPTGVQMKKRPKDDNFGPWSTSDAAPIVASNTHPGAKSKSANDGLIDFVFSGYSKYLTKVDGARCEHRPTCSHYAYLAIKSHGYVMGSFMTIDRLLRGSRSSALRSLEIYKIEDGVRYYYDPVENNAFFF